jgi:hypothetical protein
MLSESRPQPEILMKGLQMAEALLAPMTPAHLSLSDLVQTQSIDLAESLINVVMACPEPTQRAQLFQLVQRVVAVYDASGRFALLQRLIERCPYPPAKALLLSRTRKEVRSLG